MLEWVRWAISHPCLPRMSPSSWQLAEGLQHRRGPWGVRPLALLHMQPHCGPVCYSPSPFFRPGEPSALDAGPHRGGCVPGPRGNRLCSQPLLVPGGTVSAAQGPLSRQGGPRTTALALVAVRRPSETLCPNLSVCGRETEAQGHRVGW